MEWNGIGDERMCELAACRTLGLLVCLLTQLLVVSSCLRISVGPTAFIFTLGLTTFFALMCSMPDTFDSMFSLLSEPSRSLMVGGLLAGLIGGLFAGNFRAAYAQVGLMSLDPSID